MASNLAKRIAFASLAIPAVFALAYLGRWWLVLLLSAAAALGAREVYALARAQGIEALARFGMLSAALAPLAVGWPVLAPRPAAGAAAAALPFGGAYLLAAWVVALMVAAVFRRGPDRRPLASIAVTALGALYAGGLPSFALLLRHPAAGAGFANDWSVGMPLLFYPLVLTWVGDTAAMAGGRAFGGRRLTPVLSPNKTWAGGLSGLFACVAASLIYAATVFQRGGISLSLGEAIGFGAIVSVAGQLGDAAESLLKREAGVKDSSSIIPGHGGVLDRLDALYFAIPVTAMLFRARGII